MITAKLTAEHSSFGATVELFKGTTEVSVEISDSSFNAFLNTSVKIPDHLEIEGDWNGVCVCGHPVSENIQDMTFKCVYRNGSYSFVTPTLSPEVWGNTEGEQTVVFSYEEGGTVITASKTANVVAVLISLSVSGDWENIQIAGIAPDPTGLVFTATFNNGEERVIPHSDIGISPSAWANIEGVQTATFSYTYNEDTKTATKDADVLISHSIGGILYFIDSTAGGVYLFYNAEGQQVDEPTVGTDCTGWTYVILEHSVKDKFYIFYDRLYTLSRWTYYNNGSAVLNLLGTLTTLGSGRSNTALVMSADSGAYVTDNSSGLPTVWYLIQQMNVNKVGGCDDWYLGSEQEIEKLRLAGITPSWFTGYYLWCSSEQSARRSYFWQNTANAWSHRAKTADHRIFGIRSF